MAGIWNRTFWKATAERALSTTLQSGVAAIPVVAVVTGTTGITDIPWAPVGNIAALAGVLSVAKNVIVGLGSDGNPSVGSQESLGYTPRRALIED